MPFVSGLGVLSYILTIFEHSVTSWRVVMHLSGSQVRQWQSVVNELFAVRKFSPRKDGFSIPGNSG